MISVTMPTRLNLCSTVLPYSCPLQVEHSSKGGVKVVRPMWVAKMAAAPNKGGWQLSGAGKDQGTYGAVVIAHNGKCANR